MIKKILALILSLFFVIQFSVAQKNKKTEPLKSQSKKEFVITIKVKGLKNDSIIIANFYGNQSYIFSKSKFDDKGEAVFRPKNNEMPRGSYILVYKGQRMFDFLSEVSSFAIETDTTALLKNMKFKNAPENIMFKEYLEFLNVKTLEVGPIRESFAKYQNDKEKQKEFTEAKTKLEQIDNQVRAYIDTGIEKNFGTFFSTFLKANKEIQIPESPILSNGKKDSTFTFRYFKSHYWDNYNLWDDGLIRTNLYHEKLDYYIKKITYQIPDSINATADVIMEKVKNAKELYKYTCWYIANLYEGSDIMGMDAVYEHMVTKYFGYEKTPWIDSTSMFKMMDKARKLGPVLIGKKAPNMIMKDTNGMYQNLAAIKTKYTVLYFYDPDCGTCQKVTPKLVAKYDSLKVLGAEVYAVASSTRGEYVKMKDYMNKTKMKWISVADPDYQSNHRYDYSLESYPQIFVLDKDKKIIAKRLVVDQLIDFIERLNEFDSYNANINQIKK